MLEPIPTSLADVPGDFRLILEVVGAIVSAILGVLGGRQIERSRRR